MEKTLITNTRKSKAKFLGTMIYRHAAHASTYNKLRRKIRIAASTIVMSAPILTLTEKLVKNKFVKKIKNKLIPQPIRDLTPLPLKDLILHFRSILRGTINYYSFADNRPYLIGIYNLLRLSLIRTLRQKLHLNYKEILKIFGKYVKIDILKADGTTAQLDFAPPCLKKQSSLFLTNPINDPLEHRI